MREGFPFSQPKEARETLHALEGCPRGLFDPGARDGKKVGLRFSRWWRAKGVRFSRRGGGLGFKVYYK